MAESELTPAEVVELRASGFVEVATGPRRAPGAYAALNMSARLGSARLIRSKCVSSRRSLLTGCSSLSATQNSSKSGGRRRSEYGKLRICCRWPRTRSHARQTGRYGKGCCWGYREIDAPLSQVVGRIRESDQLRVRYGFPLPVEVRYDDFTPTSRRTSFCSPPRTACSA